MYAFDDEGGYEADLDFACDLLDSMSDNDVDDMMSKVPRFNEYEPDAQIYIIEQYNKQKSINADRCNREQKLVGKYLITCKGIKSKKNVYLQDRKISKGGFWTQYKSNALGFSTRKGAEKIAKSFKYNNPVVILNK